jgi:hypothetical protein
VIGVCSRVYVCVCVFFFFQTSILHKSLVENWLPINYQFSQQKRSETNNDNRMINHFKFNCSIVHLF